MRSCAATSPPRWVLRFAPLQPPNTSTHPHETRCSNSLCYQILPFFAFHFMALFYPTTVLVLGKWSWQFVTSKLSSKYMKHSHLRRPFLTSNVLHLTGKKKCHFIWTGFPSEPCNCTNTKADCRRKGLWFIPSGLPILTTELWENILAVWDSS